VIVSEEKKAGTKPLYGMFTAIPRRYDLVNHIITWGLDKKWRMAAARQCFDYPPKKEKPGSSLPQKMLDLCCGTGDLAIYLTRLVRGNLEVAGLDYSRPMLDIATRKSERLGSNISFVQGDAANLPFPDGYFDCVSISFAFRNLTYKNPLEQRHLAEMLRVLGDNGKLVIAETSQPKVKLIRALFHLYLRWFVFRIGYLVSGNRGAYHYLSESAARFYSAEQLREVLIGAGFRQVMFRPLLFGAVGIYIAIK